MNTATKSNTFSLPSFDTDAERLAAFDDLVLRASTGDRRAVGAIAIAFGDTLLEEVRGELGSFKHDAGDVLQDFFVALLERKASRFPPGRHRAIPWMCGVVRAIARKYRAERAKEWNRDDAV